MRETGRTTIRRKHPVDLSGHHALCEMNFYQLVSLLPGIKAGADSWRFKAGRPDHEFKIRIKLLDEAPYTTTVAVEQEHQSLDTPRIVVRLYHDVSMAEIISWDHHRHWQPDYPYPNPNMYHPDEKLALNRFLGDWLRFCRKQGLQEEESVIQFS